MAKMTASMITGITKMLRVTPDTTIISVDAQVDVATDWIIYYVERFHDVMALMTESNFVTLQANIEKLGARTGRFPEWYWKHTAKYRKEKT